MTYPLIALPGYPNAVSGVEGGAAIIAPLPYVRALRRAGGAELILAPDEIDTQEARRRLAQFDGLLLLGGSDISPAVYGEPPHPAVYGVDPVRDTFEIALFHAALELEMPVLAVCRGVQLVNVAMGGTLHQHIPERADLNEHRPPGNDVPVMHHVELEPGSRIAEATGTERPIVASWHHQALDRLGEGVVPVGRAEDGLVEAVELDRGWVIGVQWHPEETAPRDPAQQGLFDTLIRQAQNRAQRRTLTNAAIR